MTDRRAFEKYMESIAPSTHFGRQSCEAGGEYRTISTERAWLAWQVSRQQALEEAAKAVDALRDDTKEAEVHAKWRAAEADGLSESLQLSRASFWLTVSTVNGVLGRAAKAIRSLTSPIGDKA